MAFSVNKVIIVGNVGRDPEIRTTQDGSKVASFSVATTESWRNRESGEKQDKTEWHRVVVFNQNLAEVAEKYVHKGSKIYIEGQLQTRKWQDQTGVEKYTTEIVLSRFRGEMVLFDNKGDSSISFDGHAPDASIIDDDIPF